MPSFSLKRFALVVGFVALVAGLALLLYAVFFRPLPTPVGNEPLPAGGGLPTVGPGTPGVVAPGGGLPTGPGRPAGEEPSPRAAGGPTAVTPIVTTTTAAPVTGANGTDILYYQPDDGRFYRTTLDGQVEALGDAVFRNVDRVTWSPNREAAVLEYPDGANIVYNFRTRSQVTLPKHWQEFSFNPAGDQLAFKSLGIDRDSRWLAVSGLDGGGSQAIEPLGDQAGNVIVSWSPNRQVIALQHKVAGGEQQNVFFIGLHGENFRLLKVPGLALRSQWTPDGQALLFSAASSLSDYKPLLWVVDAAGENIGANRRSLGVNTWADKCVFSDTSTVVCGVPRDLPLGSGLQPGIADATPDDLYEINLTTGQRRLLAQPATPLTVADLVVTNDRRSVVVHDKPSGRLYRIDL